MNNHYFSNSVNIDKTTIEMSNLKEHIKQQIPKIFNIKIFDINIILLGEQGSNSKTYKCTISKDSKIIHTLIVKVNKPYEDYNYTQFPSSSLYNNIYSITEYEGHVIILIEYIDNYTTLLTLVKDNKITYDNVLSYLLVILYNLIKLHKKGIVHRDINMGNIMFSNEFIKNINQKNIDPVFIKKDNNIKFIDMDLSCIKTNSGLCDVVPPLSFYVYSSIFIPLVKNMFTNMDIVQNTDFISFANMSLDLLQHLKNDYPDETFELMKTNFGWVTNLPSNEDFTRLETKFINNIRQNRDLSIFYNNILRLFISEVHLRNPLLDDIISIELDSFLNNSIKIKYLKYKNKYLQLKKLISSNITS
jgi:serine/threonine protein kinase